MDIHLCKHLQTQITQPREQNRSLKHQGNQDKISQEDNLVKTSANFSTISPEGDSLICFFKNTAQLLNYAGMFL